MISEDQPPETRDQNLIDWQNIKRVLVIRLRSIGDTVLSTPALTALRRFLPEAQIDVLLEDWAAPVLEGFDAIDNTLTVSKDSSSRLKTARQIRRNKYDVVFNLHGGTTSTFFARASGAKYRVGYANYQYNFLYTHLLSSSADFWQQEKTHSAEQQLALLGFTGIPVEDRPKSNLSITEKANLSIEEKLKNQEPKTKNQIALLHPVAAFDTKQWATENFARTAEFLSEKNFRVVAVATKKEAVVLEELQKLSTASIEIFTDLSLPEITALAAKADLFVGNDSGIAHIAAAVKTPSVVIFGSSNRAHWRPWTDAPHEIVFVEMPCQPCAGYVCEVFDAPVCIKSVSVEMVKTAVENVLAQNKKDGL